jgi:hypothetical protein
VRMATIHRFTRHEPTNLLRPGRIREERTPNSHKVKLPPAKTRKKCFDWCDISALLLQVH